MATTGHVSANADVCAGTGICQHIAAHLFHLGDDHTVSVISDRLESESDIEAGLDAMNSCPTGAIEVTTTSV